MLTSRFFLFTIRACLLYTLCLSLATGCVSRPSPRSVQSGPADPVVVPRADPGHINWLERQSVLGMARELAAIVSGSPLGWRATGRDGQAGGSTTLLRTADLWLHVEGNGLLTKDKQNVLAELERTGLVRMLSKQGIGGMFLAPTHARGAFWNDRHLSGQAGEDAVSLGFAEHMGTDADYSSLSTAAAAARIPLGSDILPGAPGRGPDFMLATANARDYAGAWIMMDVPRQYWSVLPDNASPLNSGQLKQLEQAGIALPPLLRDKLPPAWGLLNGGWAASGETLGTDGVTRRWIYRYDANPDRPVLNWDDPSAAARRMLSASVIREVGVLRAHVAGLRLAPLIGLERPVAGGKALPEARLEPAVSALSTLAREIARYGGYSLEREALPLDLANALLAAGVDFVVDPATFPFAEHALLTGDAEPLRRAFDAALAARLPQNRLMRPLSAADGLPLALLPEKDQAAFLESLRASGWPGPTALSGTLSGSAPLYATIPALAAARLKLTPQDTARIAQQAARAEAVPELTTINALHEMVFAFRAGLPGMVWLTGQDLYGITHTTIATGDSSALPPWSPDPALMTSSASVSLYAPGAPGSFPARLADIAALRRELSVASGECLPRPQTRNPGSVAARSRLPGGGTLLVVANFSSQEVRETLQTPGAETMDIILGRGALERENNRATVTLPAFSCVWLRGRS